MDFQSAMETFAEAWVAAHTQTPLTEAAETQGLMLSGGVVSSGTTCMHEMTPERRIKQENASEAGARSPGSSSTALPLAEFQSKSMNSQAGRSIPVHCIVEQVTPQGQSVDLSQAAVDQNDYAIIPSNTLFSELVRTALNKLGYSSSEALAAKGAIQLKNWKPLTFDQITETPEATVGDILGELSTVATLRIRLYRAYSRL